MIRIESLDECKSLKQVVKFINSFGRSSGSPIHYYAGVYAFWKSESINGALSTEDDIKFHLSTLIDNKAKFDFNTALCEAIGYRKEYEKYVENKNGERPKPQSCFMYE